MQIYDLESQLHHTYIIYPTPFSAMLFGWLTMDMLQYNIIWLKNANIVVIFYSIPTSKNTHQTHPQWGDKFMYVFVELIINYSLILLVGYIKQQE